MLLLVVGVSTKDELVRIKHKLQLVRIRPTPNSNPNPCPNPIPNHTPTLIKTHNAMLILTNFFPNPNQYPSPN